MKVPLVYPKIPDSSGCMLKQCVAFEKLDGTNIHFRVTNGKWVSFGTRRDSFPCSINGEEFIEAHPELSGVLDSPEFLLELASFIRSNDKYNTSDVLLFMEYYGSKSFAGQHDPEDYPVLYLIDVQLNGRMLGPGEFLEDFKEFSSCLPDVIYKGKYSGQLIEDIRNGKYKVNEGAVIKGMIDDQVYMVKVKTNAYLERLKNQFKDNWKDYWE